MYLVIMQKPSSSNSICAFTLLVFYSPTETLLEYYE